MQLPFVFRPPTTSIPPMYTWPRSLKRLLLAFLALTVVAAYVLLGGGIIAFLALLAEWIGS